MSQPCCPKMQVLEVMFQTMEPLELLDLSASIIMTIEGSPELKASLSPAHQRSLSLVVDTMRRADVGRVKGARTVTVSVPIPGTPGGEVWE